MQLISIEAHQFRNFSLLKLEPGPQLNIFYGNNASGKTSILEAIYFLGLGKSFRTHLINQIARDDATSFSLFGQIADVLGNTSQVGIEKHIDGRAKIRLNQTPVKKAAELAHLFPTQVINSDTFNLVDASPSWRRNFLDWGLFHVERNFFPLWKKMKRALDQRNAMLQRPHKFSEIKAWDEEFSKAGEELTLLRKDYFGKFLNVLLLLLKQLIDLPGLELSFKQGWARDKILMEHLFGSYEHDVRSGYTHVGPHRSDIDITMNKRSAADILSRGEKKLLVCAMKLAQGVLLKELADKRSIYLIDDLPAELDLEHQLAMIKVLEGLGAQLFMTGTDRGNFRQLIDRFPARMFHVERGEIKFSC